MYRKHSTVIDTLLVALAAIAAIMPAIYVGNAVAALRGFRVEGSGLTALVYIPNDAVLGLPSIALAGLVAWFATAALVVWAGTRIAFTVSRRLAR